MKLALAALVITFAGVASASATPCGTFGSPTACGITVGGVVDYTVSGFTFTNPVALGGGNLYQAGDVDIDIASGGGLSLLLTFSKHPGSPTPNSVFFANAGETSQFTLQYVVTASTSAGGTVSFVAPAVVEFGLSFALGNATAQSQMILSGSPNASCSALRNSLSSTSGSCFPGNPSLALAAGDIVTLFGGNSATGSNVSFGSFTNRFDATYTPANGPTPVPEPSMLMLLGTGVAMLGGRGRFRRGSKRDR
jgi:hypothetical protein